jgi:parallel beta-helix repeat protein
VKRTALALILVGTLLISYVVFVAEANFFPMPIPQPAFIIKSDGTVDPSTAPIQREGNVYTFTGDIVGYTVAVERDNVVLDGAGYTLTGLGNSTGIFLKNRNGVTVRNMKITGFTYGIRLFAEDFAGGISAGNTLSGNILENNAYGIHVSYSSNNVLRNNQMSNNKNNFWIKGGYLSDTQSGYANDIDASNTVDGKPIIYWVKERDKTVPSDAGYVALMNCTGIGVQNLNLANNGQGILLICTTNSQITKNRVTNSESGIYVFNSQSNILVENNLANNNDGIRALDSSNNNISLNSITENKNGVYITGSSENNIISENRLTGNTVDGINLWGSRNTSIQKNAIADNNETGINFFESQNNRIGANTITGTTGHGIKFWFHSSGNSILENHVANNGGGILIYDSYENNIVGNMITENNDWGLRFEGDQNNNIIHHNNIVNNRVTEGLQVSIPGIWTKENQPGGGNVWDDGAAGNYWSDYTTRYPNATEIGSSGIGNTPYYINQNNIDRYPLMKPVTVSDLNITTPIVTEDYSWPTFKHDAQRSGFTDSPAPESDQIFWRFKTEGPITSSPAVADGIVYVGSADGYLYAVNAETGKKLWSFWIGSGVNSPTLAFGKVFVTSEPGEVIALDMHSGLQVWKQSLGEEAGFGAPLVVGSKVFVNGYQTVTAFNEAVGAQLYSEPFYSQGIAPLAYNDELIIALSSRRGSEVGCTGFEAKGGHGRFWATIASSNVEKVISGPAISEGKTYVAIVTPESGSAAFALDNGMRIWEQQLDGVTEASPAVAYGTVYIPTSNYAYALNATDGSVKWSRPMNGKHSVSSPAVADGKVFFGLDNDCIYALDAFTGDLIWSYKTEGAVQSSPAISNGLLFVGSNDGYLYAIGNPTTPFSSDKSTAVRVFSPENKTYSMDSIPFTFTVSKPVSWIGYSLDWQPSVTILGNTTLSGLTDGSHSIRIYANDTLGNTESSEAIYFTISYASELFPAALVIVSVVTTAVVGSGLLVYLKKRKR